LKFAFDGILAYQKIMNEKISLRDKSPDSIKTDLALVLSMAGYKVETAIIKSKKDLKRALQKSKSDVTIVDKSDWWENRKSWLGEPLELNFINTYSVKTDFRKACLRGSIIAGD